ncbi:MAG: hypothetical protein ACLQVI_34970 [Polyangiaceae bacterium]
MALRVDDLEVEDFILEAHARAAQELRRAGRPSGDYCLIVEEHGGCIMRSRKELALRYARDPRILREIAEASATQLGTGGLPVVRERRDGTKVLHVMDHFCSAQSILRVDLVAPPQPRREDVSPGLLFAGLGAILATVEAALAHGQPCVPSDFVVCLDWGIGRWEVIDRADFVRAVGARHLPLARAVKASVGCLMVLHSDDGQLLRITAYAEGAQGALFLRLLRDRDNPAVPRTGA